MSDNKKIPVSVYQIDISQFKDFDFAEIVDFIIKIANKQENKFNEETLDGLINQNFEIRVFSSTKRYTPRWAKFLSDIVDDNSKLKYCLNQTNSFICFIGYDNQVFAITGGFGCFAIERFIISNFGLEILVRLFDKDSKVIKSIQDRGVTGIVLGQTKFYRGDQRFSDENQFGKIFKQVKAELNKRILTKTFGFSEVSLQKKVSGCLAKSSFQINKSVNFETLLSLIIRFTEILKQKEKFALNKVNIISKRNPQNENLLTQLRDSLIEKLYTDYINNNSIDVDFSNKDFEGYLSASQFTIDLDDDEKIEFDDAPSLDEIIYELKKRGRLLDEDIFQFKESVLKRILRATDENDVLLTQGSIFQHIHCELNFHDNTYFFVDGEWYQIHPDFIADLNKECREILRQVSDDTLISKSFNIRDRESVFNQQFVGEEGWLVFDTITPDKIEACDILQFDNNFVHFIHVKKGFDNSIRDLASQIAIAAKRIKEDIKTDFNYLNKLEQETRDGRLSSSVDLRRLAKQTFPVGGLKQLLKNRKDKYIVFCLAFVDTAKSNRLLKDDVAKFQSNIAKYSLIELRREIISMGFDFKVIQLRDS